MKKINTHIIVRRWLAETVNSINVFGQLMVDYTVGGLARAIYPRSKSNSMREPKYYDLEKNAEERGSFIPNQDCPKCEGLGWYWGQGGDDTRYPCFSCYDFNKDE